MCFLMFVFLVEFEMLLVGCLYLFFFDFNVIFIMYELMMLIIKSVSLSLMLMKLVIDFFLLCDCF